MTENGTACFYSCASRVGTSLNSSHYASIGLQILKYSDSKVLNPIDETAC